jgi:hypothetical protein
MSWVIKNTIVDAQPITETRTVRASAHKLGDIVVAEHPTLGTGEFIYLEGLANTAVGETVLYNASDFSTTLAVANGIGPVAFAMSANVADQFGWYQIQGKAAGKVLTGFADNANCYLTPTAGSLDDTAVAGDYVFNCKGASAVGTPSAGLAYLEIARPFVKDGLDDAT